MAVHESAPSSCTGACTSSWNFRTSSWNLPRRCHPLQNGGRQSSNQKATPVGCWKAPCMATVPLGHRPLARAGLGHHFKAAGQRDTVANSDLKSTQLALGCHRAAMALPTQWLPLVLSQLMSHHRCVACTQCATNCGTSTLLAGMAADARPMGRALVAACALCGAR